MILLSSVRVLRVPLEHWSETAARLVVGDGLTSSSLESALSQSPTSGLRAGVALTARLRVVVLDSPDTLGISAVVVVDQGIELALMHRDFEGILGANLREWGVLELEFEAASEGHYTVDLTVEQLGFTDAKLPGEPRGETTESFSFEVSPATGP